MTPRAWILLPSGHRLNLLAPDPGSWTDEDLAIGLSRTYRWGGYSAWDLPLSVAQHSLTVLALATRAAGGVLTPGQALRELVHDAVEALMGGWDPVTPLKPYLGEGYRELTERMQAAVDRRYGLPPWDDDSLRRHQHADRLAAASEACQLGITLEPLDIDPLPPPPGLQGWEPWPPRIAERRFLEQLRDLQRRRWAGEAL
jgi:hypothetical protein